MTSIDAFTAWELLHEFDTAVMSDDDLFSFGNVSILTLEGIVICFKLFIFSGW